MVASGDSQKLIEMATIREKIRGCQSCELSTATTPVAGTLRDSDIAIIGEAPGVYESRLGRVFIGPAGQKARRWLSLAGIDGGNVSWVNVVSCYPGLEVKTPTSAHVRACGGNLVGQLEAIRPSFLLVFGSTAVSTFLPQLRVSEVRGRWWKEKVGVGKGAGVAWCTATYHPAAVLRNPDLEGDAFSDVLNFKRVYFNPAEFPRMDTCVKCKFGSKAEYWDWKEVGYCLRHKPAKGRVRSGLKEMAGQERLF